MKKIMFLLVAVIFVAGDVFAQHNGTNSMWTRNRQIRSTRNYSTGGWSYRPNGPSMDRHNVVPSWRGIGPAIQNNAFYNSNFGNYGYWGGNGKWVALAMAGADAGAGIVMNNKNQNTIREANKQDYEIRMRELDIQENDMIRDDSAALEQARWEREQAEKATQSQAQPQTQTYNSPVSYQLPVSRAYVVENHSSCNIGIVQGGEWKVKDLSPGRYETAYFKGGDRADVLEVRGHQSCVVSHEIQDGRIIINNGW